MRYREIESGGVRKIETDRNRDRDRNRFSQMQRQKWVEIDRGIEIEGDQ